jgi:hypothetical protein
VIQIESKGLRALRDELAAMQVNVTKEMRIAAWKAQKRGRAEVAKRLSKVIKQPAKRLKGASYAKMMPNDGGFIFVIREKFKIAIKRFKPRHTKAGVTVNVRRSGTHGERVAYRKAFLGGKPGKPSPKLHGAPMERVGESRYPLRTVPAIGLVAEISVIPGVIGGVGVLLKDEFRKQVRERIRFLKVKLAGKLRNQKQ